MGNLTTIRYQVKWEGRYSQCSYNNLASVLDHFYGVPTTYPPEEIFKQALPPKMIGYYGWAPYTGYMVQTQRLEWNSKAVNLNCEWFELKTSTEGVRSDNTFRIQLAEGDLNALEGKLLNYLQKGPLILWVPYGGGAFRFTPFENWRNVKQGDKGEYSAVVPWFTHCVVVGGYEKGLYRVFDCSHPSGIFLLPKDQLLVNVIAMNSNPAVKRLAYIEGYAFHCCFFQE